MKKQVNEALGTSKLAVHRTTVAQKVQYADGEVVMKVASQIIHDTLNLNNVNILHAERKSGQKTGSGLLKIEVSSEEEVRAILSRKKELKSANPPMNNIFLRRSKREEVLLMERNLDTVLSDMGVRDDYIHLSSGYLVRKDPQRFRNSHGGRGGWGGRV